MHRRHFLQLMIAASTASLTSCRSYLSEGLTNPCLTTEIPASLTQHDAYLSAWEGIDATQVWDCHTHLIGVGHGDSGIFVNDNMRSWLHPINYMQFKFYLGASCIGDDADNAIDQGFVSRLVQLNKGFPKGAKFMLLAFDHFHNEQGKPELEYTAFHTPNTYAATIAQTYPDHFEWIASIHPYRQDCVERLETAVKQGAKAVKWLPGAMGIDPSSAKCDRFYQAMAKYHIPLLTHTGSEHAVETPVGQAMGNPLLLRRPLEQGVTVIMAHCATTGENQDFEAGAHGAVLQNFEFFKRLMAEKQYEGLLYADISAITQINREIEVIKEIVVTEAWHHRLIYGSDYPLPGVMPLFSTQNYADLGLISNDTATVLAEIRKHNALMYDFLLKRHLKVEGRQLAKTVFHSSRIFNQS